MEHPCYEHENIKNACAAIPDLVEEMKALIIALNGPIGGEGFISKTNGAVKRLQDKSQVVERVLWGIGSAVMMAVLGMILKTAGIL
jgi:hypothetical protein